MQPKQSEHTQTHDSEERVSRPKYVVCPKCGGTGFGGETLICDGCGGYGQIPARSNDRT